MESPIVFTNLPLSEELCHILVSIDPYEKKDKSVKSDFQWQLLKTRLLLYSDVNVVATPAAGLMRYIHVVSKKEYFNNGSLSVLFQKLKLKVESVGSLSFPMYEQCLLYNLLVKLSPLWNKVEKYFVEGRYFLMHRGVLHAIELNILLKGDMLMLYASPLRLWLREVSLLDLLPSSNIEETLSKPFYIDLHSEPQWVHVLPSFKRGHLVYVTNRIPKESTFEDYQQMRRHWKNTYGYRLPEDDSSAIYVGISFFGNTDFLYPLECVRRGMHMNMDERTVVVSFAKAVASKAASVCGNRIKLMNLSELQNMPKIKISERLKWSVSGLAELDSELLNKWLFQGDESANITFDSDNISLYSQQEQCQISIHTAEDGSSKEQEYENWLLKCSQFIDKLTQGDQKRSFLKANCPMFNESSIPSPLKVDYKQQSLLPTKIEADSFLPEKKSDQSNTPFKPCFNKIENNVCAKKQSVEYSGKESQKGNMTMEDCDGAIFENNFRHKTQDLFHVNVALSADIPFKPVFKKTNLLHSKGNVNTFEEGKKRVSKSVYKPKSMFLKNSSSVNKGSSNEVPKKRKKKKILMDNEILKQNNSVISSEANVQDVRSEVNVQEAAVKVNQDVRSEVNVKETAVKVNDIYCEEDKQLDKNEIISIVSDVQKLPVVYENKNLDITKQNMIKRSNTLACAPKERKKSIILTTIEVENLMLTNQLEKANVPSLCCYLKGRGVRFSKDRKKDVLLEKVKEIIMSGRRE